MSHKVDRQVHFVTRVAPFVLTLETELERLAAAAQCRQYEFVAHRRTGHDRDARLLGQLDIVIRRPRIDQHAEFECRLVERLHAHPGRALAAVAETHDNPVAFAQKAAHDADEQRLVPRPDVELAIVLNFEHRAVGGFDRGVVPAPGVAKLRTPHVGGETVHDLDRTGVVNAEVAGGVGQRKRLQAASLEFARRKNLGTAHALAAICRVRHRVCFAFRVADS